ncbi:MAG TPA: hypothetical protein VFS43_01060 [Polyangiaceae bacterium]|nr:hypothetical protein [Polyangiaceae bacterium]
MAKFTLTDDRTAVEELEMREKGRKRLRLADAGVSRKALGLRSTDPKVASATISASPYDTSKGMWTVDVTSVAKGGAMIEVTIDGKPAATLPVTVVERVALPAAKEERGLLARLFLAESRTPANSSYDEQVAKTGMQWMRVVVANRLRDDPGRFLAPKAKTSLDIIRAPRQFAGFEQYPTLPKKVTKKLDDVVRLANDDSHPDQARYEKLVRNAIEIADARPVADPCPTSLYGWRTEGSSAPGPDFEKWRGLGGNDFYTLKKKK